jgi:hypothetical protein
MPDRLTAKEWLEHCNALHGQSTELAREIIVDLDANEEDLRLVRARLKVVEKERDEARASAALHARIVERSARALGKPMEGEGSSWHDIPECIAVLMQGAYHSGKMLARQCDLAREAETRAEAAEERCRALVEALRLAEWADHDDDGVGYCPICGSPSYGKHAESREIRAALAGSGEKGPVEAVKGGEA